MVDDVVIASEAALKELLAKLARTKRMVLFAGLPGVGKSLLLRELARTAHEAGRSVHLLQWDIVRLAFVSPVTEARYPDRRGQTHPMMRRAIGRWARRRLLRWDGDHDRTHLLIGEAPLVGSRLLDLVQVQADDAEALLGGPATTFVAPIPSIATRSTIERARSLTFANPVHPRERADAPSEVLRSIWQDVHALAVTLGAAEASADDPVPFDPRAYAAVYRRLLRHRHTVMLGMEANLEPSGSVYDLRSVAAELVPDAEEASSIVEQLEREITVEEAERSVASWFHTV